MLKAFLKLAAESQLREFKINPSKLQKFRDGLPPNFYETIQKENLQAHCSALNCFKEMFDIGLQTGNQQLIDSASKGMERHSREIFKYAGMPRYVDVNSAVEKLEQEGYLVVDPTDEG